MGQRCKCFGRVGRIVDQHAQNEKLWTTWFISDPGTCRGPHDYRHCGSIFLVKLQYRIPKIYLVMILVMVLASMLAVMLMIMMLGGLTKQRDYLSLSRPRPPPTKNLKPESSGLWLQNPAAYRGRLLASWGICPGNFS